MKLNKKILIGFIICIVILIGVSYFSYKNNEKYIYSNQMVNHTNQVLFDFEKIHFHTLNAETHVRGFVITGDENLLPSFENSNKKINVHLHKLKILTRNNSEQQKNLSELTETINSRLINLKQAIDIRKVNFEKAINFVSNGEGVKIQNSIWNIINRAQKIEKELLQIRKQTSIYEAKVFNVVFAVLILFIILILSFVYRIVIKNLKSLKFAEDETASKNWLLFGASELNLKLNGDQTIEELSTNAISFLCTYLNANVGAFYYLNEETKSLDLLGNMLIQIQQKVSY